MAAARSPSILSTGPGETAVGQNAPRVVHPCGVSALHPREDRRTGQRSVMLDLLQAVVSEGTGKAARIPNLGVAGETGTTQDYRDAWFIGFTSDLIVGVWVGNNDNSPMNRVVGGDLPASIWHDFVERAEPLVGTRKAPPPPAPQPRTASLDAAPASAGDDSEQHGFPDVADTGTLAFDGASSACRASMGEAVGWHANWRGSCRGGK